LFLEQNVQIEPNGCHQFAGRAPTFERDPLHGFNTAKPFLYIDGEKEEVKIKPNAKSFLNSESDSALVSELFFHRSHRTDFRCLVGSGHRLNYFYHRGSRRLTENIYIKSCHKPNKKNVRRLGSFGVTVLLLKLFIYRIFNNLCFKQNKLF
jgi:hypothetical protein